MIFSDIGGAVEAKSLLCFFQPPTDHLIWHIRMIGRMADTWGSINGSISPPRNHQDLPMLAAQSLGNRILLDIQYTKIPIFWKFHPGRAPAGTDNNQIST